MRRSRIALLLSIASLPALLPVAPAWAGLVMYDADTRELRYEHFAFRDAGHQHDVRFDRVGDEYRLRDDGADVIVNPFDADNPCRDGDDPNEALCPVDPIRGLVVQLGDESDRLEVSAAVGVFACGHGGDDVLIGGPRRDVMGGGPGRDDVYGADGDDSLGIDVSAVDPSCGPGSVQRLERLDGGPGVDGVEGGGGDDVLTGGDGDDRLHGFGGDDQLSGGDGSDVVMGLDGDDLVAGEAGMDLLYGGLGNDRLDGGPDGDVMGRTVRFDADGTLGPGDDAAITPEEGDDRLDGGDGDDFMTAGPGESIDDQLDPVEAQGRPLFDRSVTTAAPNGADVYTGGPGVDVVSYINRDSALRISLDAVANDGAEGERDQVEPDVEQVAGGSRADVMTAAAGGTLLFGDLGPDTLIGGPGPDRLAGGRDEGADLLRGAAGDDELVGGPGDDDLAGQGGRDLLAAGSGNDRAAGGAGSDAVEGGTGSDVLSGGAEVDCLHGFVFTTRTPGAPCPDNPRLSAEVGADGADRLRGGAGRDRLQGGPGEDVADYTFDRRPVVVALAGVPPGLVEAFGGSPRADELATDVEGARGGRGADTLLGNDADNGLDGGAGDDEIVGGAGVDRLRGGTGRDMVVSRDRDADAVRCGTRRDVAVVDSDDEIVAALAESCEIVDGGGAAAHGAPRVAPTGSCLLPVRLPHVRREFRLGLAATLPVGARVDASACATRVTGARGTPAGRRSAVARGGEFVLRRAAPAGRGLELRLAGGRRGTCRTRAVAVRRLRVDRAPRGLTVRGRTLRAEGPGASWTTVDGCSSTRVHVHSGDVRRSKVSAR